MQEASRFNETFARKLSVENVLQGHEGCVNRLAWNEEGTLLASGSDDRRVGWVSSLFSSPMCCLHPNVLKPRACRVISRKPFAKADFLSSCVGAPVALPRQQPSASGAQDAPLGKHLRCAHPAMLWEQAHCDRGHGLQCPAACARCLAFNLCQGKTGAAHCEMGA